MARFWDKVLEVILSRGQREKHEKYLWEKQCGLPRTSTVSTTRTPSLDKTATPEFKPTTRTTEFPRDITPNTSAISQATSSDSLTLSTPSTTPLTQYSSPIHSVNGSPTGLAAKSMAHFPSRAPLPRRPREDRAYLSLEPLIEAQNLVTLEKPWKPKVEPFDLSVPMISQENAPRPPLKRQPLLYEVPPLSQTEGIGKYRRSVNATEEFIESTTKARNDSFSDLLALALGEKTRNSTIGWVSPTKINGNMDTTSPPPPRKAFSRGNSPVRLAIYGEAADEVAEEELEERDGKLIFGRRKVRSTVVVRSGGNGTTGGNNEKALITTSDPGAMTTEAVVAAVAEEKITTAGKKRQLVTRDDEVFRGRRKTLDAKNKHRTAAVMKSRGEIAARIRHATTAAEVEEAVESGDEDIEEVESFSDNIGKRLAKAATGRTGEKVPKARSGSGEKVTKLTAGSGGSQEKEKVVKNAETAKKRGRALKGTGATGIGGAVVLKGAPRRGTVRK